MSCWPTTSGRTAAMAAPACSTTRLCGARHERGRRSPMIDAVRSKREELREAGELLGTEAVDRTGLVVTSEGAFVRILRVAPVNPLLMSGEEREKAAGGFQRLIAQLHADERLQVVVEGRPVKLEELLDGCRRAVEACAGPPPARDV